MDKKYYYVALFGIGCVLMGAGQYILGAVALLIASQSLIKQ
jgi:hypothetical protein